MKTLVRRHPHTHWVKGHFRELSNKDVVLIQARFLAGDRAHNIAKDFECSVATIYRAKNAVDVSLVHVDEVALSRILGLVFESLVKTPSGVKKKKRRRKAS